MTDPISDLLIRIKNAYMSKKSEVLVPASNFKRAICDVLLKEGYIAGYSEEAEEHVRTLKIRLMYMGKRPALTGLKILSRPGLRIYSKSKNLPRTLSGYGLSVVSTPKGVMSEKEARKSKLGGEVICQIW